MRFFEAPDHTGEPWIWAELDGGRAPILGRNDFEGALLSVWPHIVRALTAGPTLESARVVIDTLREEIAALTAANRDLNAELTSIRREIVPCRHCSCYMHTECCYCDGGKVHR